MAKHILPFTIHDRCLPKFASMSMPEICAYFGACDFIFYSPSKPTNDMTLEEILENNIHCYLVFNSEYDKIKAMIIS